MNLVFIFYLDPSDFPMLDEQDLSKLSAPEFRTSSGGQNLIHQNKQNIYRQIGQSVR